jgi:hypothetical protein
MRSDEIIFAVVFDPFGNIEQSICNSVSAAPNLVVRRSAALGARISQAIPRPSEQFRRGILADTLVTRHPATAFRDGFP